MLDSAIKYINPEFLISSFGLLGVFAIIFSESCFLFFLPGDSLLFTAGFLASQKLLSLPLLVVLSIAGAILGNQVGYWFGHKVGERFYSGENSPIFKKEHLKAAVKFYEKHGAGAIVLARFIPAVRTFTPLVAGIAKMNYKKFATFNIIGAVIWAAGLTIGGYLFGSLLPKRDVDKYLLPVIGAIIIISILPAIIHALHSWNAHRKS